MLEKTTNEVIEFGVVGQICVEQAPPPVIPAPPNPQVPRPPVPDGGGAPPIDAGRVDTSTYQDDEGDCWRVIVWADASGLPGQQLVEKIPIDCSELEE